MTGLTSPENTKRAVFFYDIICKILPKILELLLNSKSVKVFQLLWIWALSLTDLLFHFVFLSMLFCMYCFLLTYEQLIFLQYYEY